MRILLPLLVHRAIVPVIAAQVDPRVGQLARLLAAEDRRIYDPALFEAAMASPDPVVRRQATIGAGRIQDRRAGAALMALLASPDTAAHAAAMFAVGLLGDSSLAEGVIARLGDSRPLAGGAVAEAPATLAKLGGGSARTLFSRLLDGTSHQVIAQRRRLMLPGLLVEGWRFGRHAPVRAAVAHLADTSAAVRWRAAYLLGRTRAAVGVRGLVQQAGSPDPWVRQQVVRGLTRSAVDSSGLARDSARAVLVAALRDSDPGVRVNALGALATWGDSSQARLAVPLLRDRVPNVRLQAITTLAALRGGEARQLLESLADSPGQPLVIRREAQIGLATIDPPGAARRLIEWGGHPDASLRRLAVELVAAQRTSDVAPFLHLLEDADAGVAAAAMSAFAARSGAAEALIQVLARARLEVPDRDLAAAAWSAVARVARPEDAPLLVARLARELAQPGGGANGALLNALQRLYESGPEGRQEVEAALLAGATPPAPYLVRRRALSWPVLAARWGPVWPAEVQHDGAGYERLATEYLLTPATARPRVRMTIEGRGTIDLELLGDLAPLTVANFLELVDEGFFDGGEWHRVVPNFVIQDGAGGPGARRPRMPIRDEFNPVRYDDPVLGMALSGPDTGTSQWFINLSPQPHLDGGYTVFGRVVAGAGTLEQVLQGDRITRISRR